MFACRHRPNADSNESKVSVTRHREDKPKDQKDEGITIDQVMKNIGKNATMDDAVVPCVQEQPEWETALHDIEIQRSLLEELAVFERAADKRMQIMRGNHGHETTQIAELEALKIHSEPPRLLTDSDF